MGKKTDQREFLPTRPEPIEKGKYGRREIRKEELTASSKSTVLSVTSPDNIPKT